MIAPSVGAPHYGETLTTQWDLLILKIISFYHRIIFYHTLKLKQLLMSPKIGSTFVYGLFFQLKKRMQSISQSKKNESVSSCLKGIYNLKRNIRGTLLGGMLC